MVPTILIRNGYGWLISMQWRSANFGCKYRLLAGEPACFDTNPRRRWKKEFTYLVTKKHLLLLCLSYFVVSITAYLLSG